MKHKLTAWQDSPVLAENSCFPFSTHIVASALQQHFEATGNPVSKFLQIDTHIMFPFLLYAEPLLQQHFAYCVSEKPDIVRN